jgi:hypothetical protein
MCNLPPTRAGINGCALVSETEEAGDVQRDTTGKQFSLAFSEEDVVVDLVVVDLVVVDLSAADLVAADLVAADLFLAGALDFKLVGMKKECE